MDDARLLPFVFILDWDGTIAGRVDYQSTRYSLTKTMKKYGYKVMPSLKTVPKAFQPGNGLIRPGIASFMRSIKALYPNAHFFIYTASERSWALQEIGWVEKAFNIHFERPIFTRQDCVVDSVGNYRKSIQRIWPRVCRTLSKSPQSTKWTRPQLAKVLAERTIVVDNNAVYIDHKDRLLLCPDYDYTVFENLLDGFPDSAFKHPVVRQQILELINEGLVCPYHVSAANPGMSDNMHLMTKQYEWLARQCRSVSQTNRDHRNDRFWIYLRKIIEKNKLHQYSASVVQQLQQAIWKRMRRVNMV
jgi:hypothetical protein